MSTMAGTSKRARRQFSDEFKQQAVRFVLDEGKSMAAVARVGVRVHQTRRTANWSNT
jgi:transposase-like protein